MSLSLPTLSVGSSEPDWGSQRKSVYANHIVNYESMYSSRSKVGANSLRQIWTVQWSQITTDDKEALLSLFDGAVGVDAISWTPRGQSTPLDFVASDVVATEAGFEQWTVSATFTQVFDA